MQMEPEDELVYREMIDELVEACCTRFETRAAELIEELDLDMNIEDKLVDPDEKAKAKQVIHDLIPSYTPLTALITAHCLLAVIDIAQLHAIAAQMATDPEETKRLMEFLGSSGPAQDIIGKMNEFNEKQAKSYKSVNIHGDNMKIADLGDVIGGGISYN